ncbi:MAG: hypothetical protein MK052_09165 [Alphaproteobacteria bacterium]|nr:hypothetical protein [Alphaproteobacteria bacterium]
MTITHSQPPVWVTYYYNEYALILSGEMDSVWAYMLYENNIISDCLLVTTLRPTQADTHDIAFYKQHDAPPPLTSEYASPIAYIAAPNNAMFRVLWSPEGHEALIALDDQVHAYLNIHEPYGYSKALLEDGPYGQSWREFPLAHINQTSTHTEYD